MRQLFGFLAIVLMLSACEKSNTAESPSGELYGRYRGSFNRSGMDTVAVSFFFKDDNTFEGSGGMLNYPAICGGSFLRSGNSLTVNDTCAWTANFDWTLIFDGIYTINFTGENSVRIARSNGTVTDEYLLNKILR